MDLTPSPTKCLTIWYRTPPPFFTINLYLQPIFPYHPGWKSLIYIPLHNPSKYTVTGSWDWLTAWYCNETNKIRIDNKCWYTFCFKYVITKYRVIVVSKCSSFVSERHPKRCNTCERQKRKCERHFVELNFNEVETSTYMQNLYIRIAS